MTKKEALSAVLQVTVPDNTLEKALLDQDITGADAYTADDATEIDLAAIAVLEGLLSVADVSEGGFSIKYDRKSIESRLYYLSSKHGLVAKGQPTISSKAVW